MVFDNKPYNGDIYPLPDRSHRMKLKSSEIDTRMQRLTPLETSFNTAVLTTNGESNPTKLSDSHKITCGYTNFHFSLIIICTVFKFLKNLYRLTAKGSAQKEKM